jgi:hypothetical protein
MDSNIQAGLDLRTPRRLRRMRQLEAELIRRTTEAQNRSLATRLTAPLFVDNLWFWDRGAR